MPFPQWVNKADNHRPSDRTLLSVPMQSGQEETDDRKTSMIQRFHAGLDSARNLVNVLKREKWRLSKREMSVELRMGELEDYKLHLKSDMVSRNECRKKGVSNILWSVSVARHYLSSTLLPQPLSLCCWFCGIIVYVSVHE